MQIISTPVNMETFQCPESLTPIDHQPHVIDTIHLAPVVQTLDSPIQRINHYPADNAIIVSCNTYLLDSDLSGG